MKVKAQRNIWPNDFAAFFDNAYYSVATITKGLSGFKATGIYPLNPNVFTDEDFQHEGKFKIHLLRFKIVVSLFHSKFPILFNARLTLLLSYAFHSSRFCDPTVHFFEDEHFFSEHFPSSCPKLFAKQR
jgi:hypothetical protein